MKRLTLGEAIPGTAFPDLEVRYCYADDAGYYIVTGRGELDRRTFVVPQHEYFFTIAMLGGSLAHGLAAQL